MSTLVTIVVSAIPLTTGVSVIDTASIGAATVSVAGVGSTAVSAGPSAVGVDALTGPPADEES